MLDKDYMDKMVDYLVSNLSKGYSPESLKWSLINQGYSRSEISKAVEQANKELAEKKKLNDKPVIKYEVLDENENIVHSEELKPKKSFWKRMFGG